MLGLFLAYTWVGNLEWPALLFAAAHLARLSIPQLAAHMHMMSRPTRPEPLWLAKRAWLYSAALNRCWLDLLGDWLLSYPRYLLLFVMIPSWSFFE